MADFNNDIQEEEFFKFFGEFELAKVITTLHSYTTPPTYNQGHYPLMAYMHLSS